MLTFPCYNFKLLPRALACLRICLWGHALRFQLQSISQVTAQYPQGQKQEFSMDDRKTASSLMWKLHESCPLPRMPQIWKLHHLKKFLVLDKVKRCFQCFRSDFSLLQVQSGSLSTMDHVNQWHPTYHWKHKIEKSCPTMEDDCH